MKLLIAAEGPGLENLLIREPDVQMEIAAFVRKLILSRTRGPEPRVLVMPISENHVMVDVDSLIALQQKAAAT